MATSFPSHLEKLKFDALRLDGANYLDWVSNARTWLVIEDIDFTVQEGFEIGNDKTKRIAAAKARMWIVRHLSPELQQHYKNEDSALVIWKNLEDRFKNQEAILRPKALDEWNNLRFYEFKNVTDYDNKLQQIVSKMKICNLEHLVTDNELIAKTLMSFPPYMRTLAENIRCLNTIKTYAQLLSYLMAMQERGEISDKIWLERPIPSVNASATSADVNNIETYGQNNSFRSGNNNYRSASFGATQNSHRRGRAQFRGRFRSSPRAQNNFRGGSQNYRGGSRGAFSQNFDRRNNIPVSNNYSPYVRDQSRDRQCFRCGRKGHTATVCYTNNKLVRQYQRTLTKNNSIDTHTTIVDTGDRYMLSDTRESHVISDEGLTKNFERRNSISDNSRINTFMVQLPEIPESNMINIDIDSVIINSKPELDLFNCLIDCATSLPILRDQKYFKNIFPVVEPIKIRTVMGESQNLVAGYGPAVIRFPNFSIIQIPKALFVPKGLRNLIDFTTLRENNYHINTAMNRDGHEVIQLTRNGVICEEFPRLKTNLYGTIIQSCEEAVPVMISEIERTNSLQNGNSFALWHWRLGHPGSTMHRRMIDSVRGMKISKEHFNSDSKMLCVPCATSKLSISSPKSKEYDQKQFLETIFADVCGPIYPPSGSFYYFLGIKDGSSRYSYVSLISSKNMVYSKLLIQIIRLRAQYPEHPIKTIRVDNAKEFLSRAFTSFCEMTGIDLQTSVPYAHNSPAENFIKQIQTIARTILLQSNLPLEAWGHAVLHASELIRYRPSSHLKHSPHQLLTGFVPDVSHLRVFGCAVYVPIPSPKRTKFGPRRQLAIYVGFQSPSIIRYLDPTTGSLFTAKLADCVFQETQFPTIGSGGADRIRSFDFGWPNNIKAFADDYDGSGERDVRRTLHLQNIANTVPDAFADTERITNPIAIPSTIQLVSKPANTMGTSRKRIGRSSNSLETSRKKKSRVDVGEQLNVVSSTNSGGEIGSELVNEHEDSYPLDELCMKTAVVSNEENPIAHYSRIAIPREDICFENDLILCCHVAMGLVDDDEEPDPQSMEECRKSLHWKEWREAIDSEMKSLLKRNVFGPIQETPENVVLVGYRWIFVKKRNANGEVIRYKARFVAQGFTQRFGIDYSLTYSPVIDMITLRWLISFAVSYSLRMRMVDIVTAYLYGKLDKDVYMRVPEGFPNTKGIDNFKRPCVKLCRALYGLKQAGRMWHENLSNYLISCGFKSNEICPCVYVKRKGRDFVIIAIYVDDVKMVGTEEGINAVVVL